MNNSPHRHGLFPCSGRYPSKDLLTRREMLFKSAGGLGGIALTMLLSQTGLSRLGAAGAAPGNWQPSLAARSPQFPAKAKNVILLYMGGGPSQIDMFDPKPLLKKFDGQRSPFAIEQRDLHSAAKVMASPFSFKPYGQCGMEVSELLPHTAGVVDDLALVRSGVTNRIDHGEALLMMHTGRPISGFPTMGSWITYGLGTENQNLPAYVSMPEGPSERVRNATSSGWLPALYQGTPMNVDGKTPFYYLNRDADAKFKDDNQEKFRQLTQALNRNHLQGRKEVTQLDARIQNYELAARMQLEAMRQVDIAKETDATRALYGIGNNLPTDSFGRRCLVARRLVESGVRFVHVMRNDWDHHGNLTRGLRKSCLETDQPIAGLIRDLKSRGLFEETLVIWTGEFGRLPVVEGSDGRDHNPFGYSFWMAGGGVKGGTIYGSTDDFGYRAVENPVTVADFHATVLDRLGFDHKKLIYEFEGREETLTGVEKARVVRDLLV